jgi:ubiquinone/menaquinone biosynthesis C-methylase UbiE
MTNTYKQTWWDNNLNNEYMFNVFLGWVGDSSAKSKVFFREFLKQHNFESIIDIGCGPATEFFGFKNDNINIEYTGVDSSAILVDKNLKQGIPMIKAEAHSIPVEDSSYEIAFSRHVLEHQPAFGPVLDEMIRIGKKLAAHTWFKKPSNEEVISYDPAQQLYHNTYNKEDINKYILSNQKVKNFEWIEIDETECLLLVWLK